MATLRTSPTSSGGPGPELSIERVCASTGLRLSRADGRTIWRIAKTSYGALSPQRRLTDGDPLSWGRFDVAGHRTVYGASCPEAAYAESLAVFRPKFTADGPLLGELFDDVGSGDPTTLLEEVAKEWAERDHMPPGSVPAGWRDDRRLYPVTMPAEGWFIDVERAESISAISTGLTGQLADLGLVDLTTGHLHGENRAVTTAIAGWARSRVLDDGSLPHGIRYTSKHDSTWVCWAIWLRAVDDDKPLAAEPTKAQPAQNILTTGHNPAMATVLDMFHLRCH